MNTEAEKKPNVQPIVTYVLLGITLFIYIAQLVSEAFLQTDIPVGLGLKVNELIHQGQYWRLITPIFLHSGILHVGINMFALYSLGSSVELLTGRLRFILIYLLSGFAGYTLSFLFSDRPTLGSAPAIFGLLAAEAVFFYQNRGIIGEQAIRVLQSVGIMLGINLLLGLLPGFDIIAPLGGVAGGLSFAIFGGPLLQIRASGNLAYLVDVSEPRDAYKAALMTFVIFAVLASMGILFPPA